MRSPPEDSPDPVGTSRGRATLRIRVTPRARTTGVTAAGGHLAVRVRAAAEGGKATEEAIRAVAGLLGIGRSRLEVIAGATSRLKTLGVEAIDPADLRKLLAKRLENQG